VNVHLQLAWNCFKLLYNEKKDQLIQVHMSFFQMHIVHSLHIAIYNLCLHKIIFLSFHKAKFSLVKVKENIFGNCGDKENLKKKKNAIVTCLCSSISKMFLKDTESSTKTGWPEIKVFNFFIRAIRVTLSDSRTSNLTK